MKIYTKTGDDGSTGLIGGGRVSKGDERIACTGDIDELNAALGWAAVATSGDLPAMLHLIQSELFVIGAQIATPEPAPPQSLPALDETAIARLEMEIDSAVGVLEPLRNFILPGGSESSARLHLARTVCRRAERRLVAFSHDRPVPMILLTYVNRLSDWLFTMARKANLDAGVADVAWMPNTRR